MYSSLNPTKTSALDQLCVNTIRTLSIDAVQKANSGHPGAPMGLAPVAYVLWDRFLRHSPANPHWPNRDRFAALRRARFHAALLDAAPDRLRPSALGNRALPPVGLATPGHPEYGLTPGVETTTGPLGQGIANSVGMAIAERWLAAHFNQGEDKSSITASTPSARDGDMMEGISHEAAALAGHLKLSNLIWFYDYNHVSLDGPTSRPTATMWSRASRATTGTCCTVDDATIWTQMEPRSRAQAESERPTLIIVNSHIGYGAPNKQDTSAAHTASRWA